MKKTYDLFVGGSIGEPDFETLQVQALKFTGHTDGHTKIPIVKDQTL